MTMSQEATGIAGILGAFKLLCTCENKLSLGPCHAQYSRSSEKTILTSLRPLAYNLILSHTPNNRRPVCCCGSVLCDSLVSACVH